MDSNNSKSCLSSLLHLTCYKTIRRYKNKECSYIRRFEIKDNYEKERKGTMLNIQDIRLTLDSKQDMFVLSLEESPAARGNQPSQTSYGKLRFTTWTKNFAVTSRQRNQANEFRSLQPKSHEYQSSRQRQLNNDSKRWDILQHEYIEYYINVIFKTFSNVLCLLNVSGKLSLFWIPWSSMRK